MLKKGTCIHEHLEKKIFGNWETDIRLDLRGIDEFIGQFV